LAKEYVQTQKYPLVVKASGLAAGKGCSNLRRHRTREATLHQFMIDKILEMQASK
jgi:phosphoribosylamine--glycine ligase